MDEGSSDRRSESRSLGSLLRWAVDRYRAHPELLVPFAVVAVFGVALEASLELLEELVDVERDLTVRVDTDVYDLVLSEYVPDALLSVLEELLWLFAAGVAINVLLTVVAGLFAVGIAALVAADATAGRTRTQTDRAAVAAARLPALFAVTLIATVFVGVGLLLLVLPGLYLAVRLAFAAPAVAVEGRGPIEGLRTGWAASKGRGLEVGMLLGFTAIAASLAVLVPFLGGVVVALAVLPLFALAVTRCYVSARGSAISNG